MFEAWNYGMGDTPYDLAIGAGCSPAGATIAAAIAQAESSGNARAYNPETAAGTPAGKGSYGLWQIYLKAHPEYAGQSLYDPATNAAAMYAVSGGCQNWSPWSTYKNGAYQNYLSAGATGSTGDDSGSGGGFSLPSPDALVQTLTQGVDLFSGGSALLPVAAIVLVAWFLLR